MIRYEADFPHRHGVAELTLQPDRIVLDLAFDPFGLLGDEHLVTAWVGIILAPFEGDPRPVEVTSCGELVQRFGAVIVQ